MITLLPRAYSRNGWSAMHVVFAALMVVVGVAITFDSWKTLYITAVYYNHALYVLAIPFIALWMFYVRRHRMRFCTPRKTWIGLILIAVGWCIFAFGHSRNIATVNQYGSLVVVLGCLFSVIGIDIPRKFLPAFFILILLVPIPAPIAAMITEPMQSATTDITQVIYGFFGVGIEREGNIMINENGDPILIAETSRMMGLFMSFIIMAYAFAFGLPLRTAARAIVLIVSPFAALVASILRSLATTWMYNEYDPVWVYSQMSYLAWVTLVLSIVVYYIIIQVMIWTTMPIERFSVPKELY